MNSDNKPQQLGDAFAQIQLNPDADIILRNNASLIRMGKGLENVGYTLIGNGENTKLFNALTDKNDEEYNYNWVELSTEVCYDNGEDGPRYDQQYGFEFMYPTEGEQKDVLHLIKMGYGIGAMIDSDQDVFVRWSMWEKMLDSFKQTIERLNNRKNAE